MRSALPWLLLLLLAGSANASGGRAVSLEAELEAARGQELYLLLDARGRWVDLKANGLLLRRFPVESALFGSPRMGGGDEAWPAASFQIVSELPEPERPRIPIQAPDDRTGRPGLGKPVAEADLSGVPSHYRLRFEPALDLSVLGEAGVEGLPGRLWRLRHRLVEGWGALARRLLGEPVPPRVVLVMRPEEARRLFVALRPNARMVVR
ncbi:MAG: hypothetical protein ACLGI9_12910 [Thermoanaerobaculia bacterium]